MFPAEPLTTWKQLEPTLQKLSLVEFLDVGADKIENNRDGKKAEPPNALCEFGRAAFYSAIQAPVNSVGQLVNEATGENTVGKMGLVNDPARHSLTSSSFYAQQLGNAAGMLVPFVASQKLVKAGTTSVAHRLGLAETSKLAQFAKTPGGINTFAVGNSAAAGFTCDFLFTPSDPTKDVLTGHLKNGTAGAVTFGSLSAFNVGLTGLSKQAHAKSTPWLIHSTKHDIGRHMISGAGAGLLSANTHALLEGRIATTNDMLESALTMSALGGLMRGKQEFSSRRQGTTSISDAVAKSPEMQTQIQSDPMARKILTEYGTLQVEAQTPKKDFYKLMDKVAPPQVGDAAQIVPHKPDSRITVLKDGSHNVSTGFFFVENGATVKATGDAILIGRGGTIEISDKVQARVVDTSVKASGESIVDARGSSTVHAYDRAQVTASGDTIAYGHNNSTIKGQEHSFTKLSDQSTGIITGQARGSASDNSHITARDEASVSAYGQATVDATGKAFVSGHDNAKVKAAGETTVNLVDEAHVRASGNVKVDAGNNATVVCTDNVSVKLFGQAQADASGNSKVEASGQATVRAEGSSHVDAMDNCKVSMQGSSTATAKDTVRVYATGHTKVTATQSTTVEAKGNTTVALSGRAEGLLFGYATGEARGAAKVVLYERSSVVARDKVSVTAVDGSSAVAYDHAHINASNTSHASGYGEATLKVKDEVSAFAFDNASVESRGNANVTAYNDSKVVAHEDSNVIALGSSRVHALASTKVYAFENSRVLASGTAEVTCSDNVKAKAVQDATITINPTVRRFPVDPRQPAQWQGQIMDGFVTRDIGGTYPSHGVTVMGMNSATIRGSKGEVIARDDCKVDVQQCSVIASDFSYIKASNESHVVASGKAKVQLKDKSTGTAAGHADVHVAGGGSFVRAEGKATVKATGDGMVEAGGESTVSASGTSKVRAKDWSVVTASENSSVSAIDNSRVTASGEAQVRVNGTATVEAGDRTFVEAWGDAKVITSGEAHAVLSERSTGIATEFSVVEARGDSVVQLATGESQILRFDRSKVVASGDVTIITPFDSPAIKLKEGAKLIVSQHAQPLVLAEGKSILLDQFHYRPGHGTMPKPR